MAFLDQEINVNDLPQSTSYEVLPEGWYTASITKADLQATKDGTGQYIKIRFDITGPTHQGRVVFGNINIRNASSEAEKIGRDHLGKIMRAIGLTSVRDTDQLIGGQLQVKVAIRPAQGQYGESNDIKDFKSATGGSAPVAPKAAAAAPAAAKAPWMK